MQQSSRIFTPLLAATWVATCATAYSAPQFISTPAVGTLAKPAPEQPDDFFHKVGQTGPRDCPAIIHAARHFTFNVLALLVEEKVPVAILVKVAVADNPDQVQNILAANHAPPALQFMLGSIPAPDNAFEIEQCSA